MLGSSATCGRFYWPHFIHPNPGASKKTTPSLKTAFWPKWGGAGRGEDMESLTFRTCREKERCWTIINSTGHCPHVHCLMPQSMTLSLELNGCMGLQTGYDRMKPQKTLEGVVGPKLTYSRVSKTTSCNLPSPQKKATSKDAHGAKGSFFQRQRAPFLWCAWGLF